MENSFEGFYNGKTVLVTGHTGFKGGWLTTWLKLLGARVIGLSLDPEDTPNLFEVCRVGEDMVSLTGDIRDVNTVAEVVKEHRPEIVFHLAAQSLVRTSYEIPVETYATNVMGTVHLLDAVRSHPTARVIVNVTSDKCYDNREWSYSYRENDPMGGADPYSSSKGCAELVTEAFRRSFFDKSRHSGAIVPALASARAGNVIGGGDWAQHRLVPDCMRALAAGKAVSVRNPDAVRPWQHVLEPLSGYLLLGLRLWQDGDRYQGGWNFGPHAYDTLPVREMVQLITSQWGDGSWEDISEKSGNDPHEASTLRLDCSKATTELGWRPVYRMDDCIRETVEWYRNFHSKEGFEGASSLVQQISSYTRRAREAGLPWA